MWYRLCTIVADYIIPALIGGALFTIGALGIWLMLM